MRQSLFQKEKTQNRHKKHETNKKKVAMTPFQKTSQDNSMVDMMRMMGMVIQKR